jgi:UDP-N-acetylglucosamine 2-epimerase
MKTVLTIVGARPQFIKAAPISKVIRNYFREILIHTGQHYDTNMSEVFFSQLSIPLPNKYLEVGSGSHAYQTATMMIRMESVFNFYKPDAIIIYGDTNSTLAAALTASKLHIPIAHIEAGLRNFDLHIPEEINRVVADKLSKWLFAPTDNAVENLAKEGIVNGVYKTGDVMYDALLYTVELSKSQSSIIDELGLSPEDYSLCTIHRAENTDNIDNLKNILEAICKLNDTIVFPIHPRTRKIINKYDIRISGNVRLIQPLGHLDFVALTASTKKIITDSGGVQREAYWLKKPCITVFPSTSWPETVLDGWNRLVSCDVDAIIDAYRQANKGVVHKFHFGDGKASEKIVNILREEV